jgi:PEP-CTERM motif
MKTTNSMRLLLALCSAGALAQAGTISRGLPAAQNGGTYYVNDSAPTRDNYAYSAAAYSGGGAISPVLGDDFVVDFTGTVNSLTLYEVSNNTPPTTQFSGLTLYYGVANSSYSTITLNQSSSNYTYQAVSYANNGGNPGYANYENVTHGFDTIYAITFSNLNLNVDPSVNNTVVFGLDTPGAGVNLSSSNTPLTLQSLGNPPAYDAYAPNSNYPFSGDGFLIFNNIGGGQIQIDNSGNTGFCGTGCESAPVATSLNFSADFTATPEPSTFAFLGIGALGIALGARRRKA